MSDERRINRLLKGVNNYLTFFALVAFVITCCTMLFLSTLSDSLNITFTEGNISTAAKLTFINVIFLSLIFCMIDAVRRRYTVERPVKQIISAAEKIIRGEFEVRIESQNWLFTDDTFNEIIECFNKMAQELGSVETLRTDFIANVSHEMKTPLSVIQNYGTLLQAEDISDEKRIEYAKGVVEGSRRMADMMTNILKLNRLENQQIYPKTQEFNLSEQICECILQYENVWEKSEIDINTDIEDDVMVNADAELLSIVWNNLLSNAFKFTEQGGMVTVRLATEGVYAVVQVKDTGCGMSSEVGSHIFEKFYQGDTSHSTQGNGLGLALVKKVVDIMQGEISVESIQGKGSSFTVKIQRIL